MEGYDAVVIGGGAAGQAAARGLGRLGARVLLVERESLGGDCMAWGCVPSKTFLHLARLLMEGRKGPSRGIGSGEPSFDYAAARRYVAAVQSTLGRRDLEEGLKGAGVELLQGTPRLLAPDLVDVGGQTVRARHVVLATGAQALPPPVAGLSEIGYLDSRRALQLETLPRSLLILGGGPIGVEFAQMYRRMGVAVTLVDANPRPLPREEPEVGEFLLGVLKEEGVLFLGQRRALRAEKTASGKGLVLTDPAGQESRVEAEEILVATGRSPNVEGLDLRRAGVAHDRTGIQVDRSMRTTAARIWAVGDCNGLYQFAHMAEHEAGVAVRNIVRSRLPSLFLEKMHFRAVAWVTYTDPEVAHCGLTEAEARERGIPHHVLTYRFDHLDRAVIEDRPGGLTKVLTDRRGRLLGAHMVGAHAGELLQELVLGVRLGLRVSDISQTVHPYPAFVQMARRAANVYYARTLYENPRRLALLKRLAGFTGREKT